MATLKETLISDGLNPLLGQIQKLEVFDEVGKIASPTLVSFAYQNWLAAIAPSVERNRVDITTGYTADFAAGTLTFATPLVEGDEVRGGYTFQYFTDEDLGHFLDLALNTVNNQRPQTSFTLDVASLPQQWYTSLVELAYIYCMETLLRDLMTWRGTLPFNDPRGAAGYAQSIIQRLWGKYQTDKKELKGRRYLTPQAAASGRWRYPRPVGDYNWQQYTVIRG